MEAQDAPGIGEETQPALEKIGPSVQRAAAEARLQWQQDNGGMQRVSSFGFVIET